ncbi:AI-2E family transporter [Candidatus Woesearchaeota archaeon]|nr:AI-2E family transporter [Candidatus Woesearchaeota archaeon]
MKTRRYVIAILAVLAVVVAFLLIRPFVIPLMTSMVLAYLFYPIHKGIQKRIKSRGLSAAIVTVIIIVIIVIPTAFLLFQVSKEASIGYLRIKQTIAGGFEECESGFICDVLKRPGTMFYIQDGIKKITETLTTSIYNFVFTAPKFLLDILIIFFTTFFFLKDGKEIIERFRELTPLESHQEERIFRQMKEVTRSIIYGLFLIAIIEGVIGAIVFKVAGVSAPILWGTAIALLAFIPFIGSTIVWIPAAIIMILTGDTSAFGIILAGGLVISYIDTFIKPKAIGKRAKVHPLLVLLGLIGGIQLFGLIGIIIGPLVLALLITFIKMYKEEKG